MYNLHVYYRYIAHVQSSVMTVVSQEFVQLH